MDKPDFIWLIQMVRKNAAIQTNIICAWRKIRLFPIEPQIIFYKLGFKTQALEPLEATTPTASHGDSVSILSTPANVKYVDAVV